MSKIDIPNFSIWKNKNTKKLYSKAGVCIIPELNNKPGVILTNKDDGVIVFSVDLFRKLFTEKI